MWSGSGCDPVVGVHWGFCPAAGYSGSGSDSVATRSNLLQIELLSHLLSGPFWLGPVAALSG